MKTVISTILMLIACQAHALIGFKPLEDYVAETPIIVVAKLTSAKATNDGGLPELDVMVIKRKLDKNGKPAQMKASAIGNYNLTLTVTKVLKGTVKQETITLRSDSALKAAKGGGAHHGRFFEDYKKLENKTFIWFLTKSGKRFSLTNTTPYVITIGKKRHAKGGISGILHGRIPVKHLSDVEKHVKNTQKGVKK